MKKKILSLALVVALIAIMVGGSLAYFTDNDQVTNTFTIGSVKVEVYENNEATDSDTMDFGMLTPIVNVENPSADVSYVDKVVNVKNTGRNDAYVRVHIAVPSQLAYTYLILDVNTEGWNAPTTSEAVVEGVTYTVFTYDYATAIAPTVPTNVLLKGVYLASDVDLQEDAYNNLEFVRRENGVVIDESDFIAHTKNADGSYTPVDVNVLVAVQAIQADGFADAETALDAGFQYHPWPVE